MFYLKHMDLWSPMTLPLFSYPVAVEGDRAGLGKGKENTDRETYLLLH